MTLRQQLLEISDIFGRARALSRARVSTIVFTDGKRLTRIAEGSDLGTGNFERAMQWFSDNWPDGAEWPEGIDRPQPTSTEAAE